MAEVTYSKPLRSDGGAGNVDCMRLAEIIREVVAAPRGDGIDTGLILLRRLAEFGYHVVHRQEILPCGCDVVNTGTWVRKKCGCLPVSAVRPSVETSAPPFDVEKAKRAVRYDQKRFGNADETSPALPFEANLSRAQPLGGAPIFETSWRELDQPDETSATSQLDRFECPFCERKFASAEGREHHMDNCAAAI